ncbi:MAG: 4'-phosphopantetheinyl transferase superfamily protein [Candidatus Fermentibacteria bacterium]|nr:4'-phosphopantetheinyl transferase superfamily protein [Candidatus Fermentibacteria bacterium]
MKTGTDVVENSRFIRSITRNEGRLRSRLFTLNELKNNPGDLNLAVMFSVKESVAKALETGFDSSLSWHDIEVHITENGVKAILSGKALELAGNSKVLISTTQDQNTSLTFALLT